MRVDQVGPEQPQVPPGRMLGENAACSMIASSGSTPEWLATIRAAPLSGTFASPRDCTRNQFRYSASAAGISTAEFRSGSKPNWSTS